MEESKQKKLESLLEKGSVPFAYNFDKNIELSELQEKFKEAGHEPSKEVVRVAGRIHSLRLHGKALFADLKNACSKVQIYLREDSVNKEQYSFFKDFVDSGDILGVEGKVFRTKKGELTVWVSKYNILSKSLCVLPEKFHGLKDTELRYRKRYLDLLFNEETMRVFTIRSKAIHALRSMLISKGFIEVETPILQPLYGGANAQPFETHHNFLNQKLYLRIAPELYLKRLLVGGMEKVFEIGKNFRNESITTLHNPEFSMIEIYESYCDYTKMMDLTEEVISGMAKEACGSYKINFSNIQINLKPGWERISMADAVKKHAKIDVLNTSLEDLKKIASEKGFFDSSQVSRGDLIVAFFEALAEPFLKQPVFITDFPIEVSPLAKPHRSKEGFAERFELFINRMEIANGFSELNDPLEQKKRFEMQEKRIALGDKEAHRVDYDYINALCYGMPPAGGVGIGLDRLLMLLSDKKSIKEVILFPHMRNAGEEFF